MKRLVFASVFALFPVFSQAGQAWKQTGSDEAQGIALERLEFQSQSWQGSEWSHSLVLAYGKGVSDFSRVILVAVEDPADFFDSTRKLLNGGFQGTLAAAALRSLGYPVAVVNRIPPVPQLGVDRTDQLIGESLKKYLSTGDAAWPVVLPMAQAISVSMDVIQDFTAETKSQAARQFLLAGGSKTAWAAWLAAIQDERESRHRVAGLFSIAFNALHFEKNLLHQNELWGKLSDPLQFAQPILDALLKGFFSKEKRQAKRLARLVDPYYGLGSLTFPKLLVNGANDPYFPSDSERFYWNQLKGTENHRLYLPNFGHHGSGGLADVSSLMKLLPSVQGFIPLCFSEGARIPRFKWKFHKQKKTGEIQVYAQLEEAPKALTIWYARSSSRDFRKSAWNKIKIPGDPAGKSLSALIPARKVGEGVFTAAFLEVQWNDDAGSSSRRFPFVESSAIEIMK